MSGIKDVLEEELRFSASVVSSGAEVVARFRIMVPGSSDYVVFVPMPDEARERARRRALISGFMAWKGAQGYVLSCELLSPDCVVSVAVTRFSVFGGMRAIERKWLAVGATNWLSATECGGDMTDLLPQQNAEISVEMLGELERVFGPQGEFSVERLQA